MKLYPRCHPYWIDGETKTKLNTMQILTHTAEGHLLPCCMCDTSNKTELSSFGMFDEELKIENVDNIKRILLSKQWINFHKMLLENPDSAPKICKKYCGIKYEWLIDEQQ
jgi:hypothetical protein